MIEQVLSHRNLIRAYRQVVSNKGSAGVDGMPVGELYQYLSRNRERLVDSIRSGRYLPQPILGVEIPKSNGKTRLLGVPTVTDRMLQQAVGQVLAVKFEREFKDTSFGFRPNRNAQQAVLKAQEYINSGFCHIVDIDLKSFFDEVDHCLLLELLYRKVKCPATLRLIRKWLRAPMLVGGLDRELERQGLRFVRYADDFSIYLKSRGRAQEVGNQTYLFLKRKLKLPINREKSGIRKPSQFTILGFGFTSTFVKGAKGKYQLVASEKGWRALKQKVKAITRKTTPCPFDERIQRLKELHRGWIGYYRLASMQAKLKELDGWVRNRLRYCIWHHWKKPERKRKNLIRLGIEPEMAYAWSRTRRGG